MAVIFDGDDVALRADARVDDGDMYCAGREIAIGPHQPEACFGRPVDMNFMRQVDDAYVRGVLHHHALHDGDKGAFVAEIGGQCDGVRYGDSLLQRCS